MECTYRMQARMTSQQMSLSSAAVAGGLAVGRALGHVFGATASGALALGVGATVGAARSLADASSSVFQRAPALQSRALGSMPTVLAPPEVVDTPQGRNPVCRDSRVA